MVLVGFIDDQNVERIFCDHKKKLCDHKYV